ncbi:permease [Yoonia sp. I 8.24]|uniref:permease n=1 Tax=Yoonia sp. I 8.24 TaxID=1537229 RepID=UPI001EDD595F|nr:permease [Yoonia sp. I 8.24]MCG3269154.1 permease [Yoonia sp. I 8.24]
MTEINSTSAPRIGAYLNRLKSPWTLTLLIPVIVAILDQPNAIPVIEFAIRALLGTLPYIVFAVIMIAGLKAAGAESVIAGIFKGRETRMIFLAALFGGLAPFCSCEVIPFIAGLLALGTPLAPVMAFWLASPLIDPPTLLITAGALGWPFAIAKAFSAVGLGLMGGFAIKLLQSQGLFASPLRATPVNRCGCGPDPMNGKPVWAFWKDKTRVQTFQQEFTHNALFLLKWLAFAYMLEALLITYVPASLIAGLVGGEGILPIATAAVVGVPAYLNGFVAPPLIAGLMEQGMSSGSAMAFVIGGGVTSIPAMAAVWSLVKRQVFAAYIALGMAGAVASGIVFQLVG